MATLPVYRCFNFGCPNQANGANVFCLPTCNPGQPAFRGFRCNSVVCPNPAHTGYLYCSETCRMGRQELPEAMLQPALAYAQQMNSPALPQPGSFGYSGVAMQSPNPQSQTTPFQFPAPGQAGMMQPQQQAQLGVGGMQAPSSQIGMQGQGMGMGRMQQQQQPQPCRSCRRVIQDPTAKLCQKCTSKLSKCKGKCGNVVYVDDSGREFNYCSSSCRDKQLKPYNPFNKKFDQNPSKDFKIKPDTRSSSDFNKGKGQGTMSGFTPKPSPSSSSSKTMTTPTMTTRKLANGEIEVALTSNPNYRIYFNLFNGDIEIMEYQEYLSPIIITDTGNYEVITFCEFNGQQSNEIKHKINHNSSSSSSSSKSKSDNKSDETKPADLSAMKRLDVGKLCTLSSSEKKATRIYLDQTTTIKTMQESYPWCEIDLGETYEVRCVNIKLNSSPGAAVYSVIATEEKLNDKRSSATIDDPHLIGRQLSKSGPNTMTFSMVNGTPFQVGAVRYVVIQLDEVAQINLESVSVYGFDAPSSSTPSSKGDNSATSASDPKTSAKSSDAGSATETRNPFSGGMPSRPVPQPLGAISLSPPTKSLPSVPAADSSKSVSSTGGKAKSGITPVSVPASQPPVKSASSIGATNPVSSSNTPFSQPPINKMSWYGKWFDILRKMSTVPAAGVLDFTFKSNYSEPGSAELVFTAMKRALGFSGSSVGINLIDFERVCNALDQSREEVDLRSSIIFEIYTKNGNSITSSDLSLLFLDCGYPSSQKADEQARKLGLIVPIPMKKEKFLEAMRLGQIKSSENLLIRF